MELKQRKSSAKKLAFMREYWQRPEVKARRSAYVEARRARANELSRKRYAARPDVREKAKALALKWYAENTDRANTNARKRNARLTPEQRREERRRSYLKHHDECLLRQKEWCKANPGANAAGAKAWRDKFPLRAVEGKKRTIAKKPELYRELRARGSARRRALEARAPVIEKIDRRAIIARDKSTCRYCFWKLLAKEVTLDHVLALANGGNHTAVNLVVACLRCNTSKGDILVDVWLASPHVKAWLTKRRLLAKRRENAA